MANNTTLNPGSGGDTFKSEDIGSYKVACSKIIVGAAGVDGGPVTTSNPFPVAVQGTVPVSGAFFQTTQPVSGTVSVGNFPATQPVSGTVTANAGTGTMAVSAASLPLPAGAATETTLAGVSAKLGSLGQKAMAASAPVVIASDQSAVPTSLASLPALAAGTNLVGVAIAPQQTGAMYSGTTALTPKFAAIAASSSGSNAIVALVTGKRIRVLRFTLIAAGAVTAKFQSNATDLTGAMAFAANGGAGAPYCPVGVLETGVGEALNLNLGGAVSVAGNLTYIEV